VNKSKNDYDSNNSEYCRINHCFLGMRGVECRHTTTIVVGESVLVDHGDDRGKDGS